MNTVSRLATIAEASAFTAGPRWAASRHLHSSAPRTENRSRSNRNATIIAGMFDTVAKANLAVEDLRREQFDPTDVGVFHINAPGQHDTYPVGGEDYEEERQAGVMVAVNTGDGARQLAVIDVLRARGAATIEKAEGKWRDGDWVDFDPVRRPSYIAPDMERGKWRSG